VEEAAVCHPAPANPERRGWLASVPSMLRADAEDRNRHCFSSGHGPAGARGVKSEGCDQQAERAVSMAERRDSIKVISSEDRQPKHGHYGELAIGLKS
jgi:hypothetical protein